VQFIWWGYHLIELTEEINKESELVAKRVTMIIGEGAVFLLLLLVGIWQIRRSIKKDLQLSQRQKNFLLSVTHELKTPLAANKLYIQTVTKRELDASQRKELLDKAIDENSRLERMIDNILNASRLENNALKANKEKFDLAMLINQVAERFTSINEHLKLEVSVKENTSINADRIMIEAILGNLIENAIKYAGTSNKIEVFAQFADGKTVFGVKDNGPGIPKEIRQDIFKKFFRAENEETRSKKGSGLGLYIVDQLVHIHDGQISVSDNTPSGTVIEITI
jgi:signal transduction histidine kinase